MEVKAGQFLAVHSEGFLPDSIQFFERIQEFRENDKPKLIVNHIAEIIHDENGILSVYEMGAKGCVKKAWTESDYFKNKSKFVILELIDNFNSLQLLNYTIAIRNDKGKGYDFLGILHQIIFTLTGIWLGKTGSDAKKRFYCSEQAATRIHEQKPLMFPKPYQVNPQIFFEDKGLKIVGSNFDLTKIN